MRILLDTQIAIWALTDTKRLSERARTLIGDEAIGKGIVETLAGHRSRAVLMRNRFCASIRSSRTGPSPAPMPTIVWHCVLNSYETSR